MLLEPVVETPGNKFVLLFNLFVMDKYVLVFPDYGSFFPVAVTSSSAPPY